MGLLLSIYRKYDNQNNVPRCGYGYIKPHLKYSEGQISERCIAILCFIAHSNRFVEKKMAMLGQTLKVPMFGLTNETDAIIYNRISWRFQSSKHPLYEQ